jgi:hypothetical protein
VFARERVEYGTSMIGTLVTTSFFITTLLFYILQLLEASTYNIALNRRLQQLGRRLAAASSSSEGASGNITHRINAALLALASAVLRAASVHDPPVSVSAGPGSAFASNGSAASYCGNALSMTAQRLSTRANASIALGRPLAPCTNASNASYMPRFPSPTLHINDALLQAARAGYSGSALDVSLVQVRVAL